jgi:hypothetical protein
MQKGFPISQETYAEKFGIQGYEVEQDKYRAEKVNQGVWELEAKATLAAKQHELGLDPPPPDKPGQGKGGGRPSTGAKPAHLEQKGSKDGNVRVVNSTS